MPHKIFKKIIPEWFPDLASEINEPVRFKQLDGPEVINFQTTMMSGNGVTIYHTGIPTSKSTIRLQYDIKNGD